MQGAHPSRGGGSLRRVRIGFCVPGNCASSVKIKLQEQPFHLLQMLLEHPGEIVTRQELQRIWPADIFVDFDQGLNNTIKRLEALSDSADTPRFIETIPRPGYRFIGVTWKQHARTNSVTGGLAFGKSVTRPPRLGIAIAEATKATSRP